jgi:hypothetical protein
MEWCDLPCDSCIEIQLIQTIAKAMATEEVHLKDPDIPGAAWKKFLQKLYARNPKPAAFLLTEKRIGSVLNKDAGSLTDRDHAARTQ